MSADVILRINGINHRGFEAVQIGKSIEAVSGFFELTLSDRWVDQHSRQTISLAVNTGDTCQVFIGDQYVIDGYAEEINIDYNKDSHTISVAGRDKTADIIDCSAEYKTGQFKNLNIQQIAERLCKPYDIDVVCPVSPGAVFKNVAINDGETIFETLERLARHRGLLLNPLDGKLLLTKPSTEVLPVVLETGKNILSGKGRFTKRDRFHTYEVKSQTPSDDNWNGSNAIAPSAIAVDRNIRAPRKRIIVADDAAYPADCQKTAEWHRNVASGRGSRVAYTVAGWGYDSHGKFELWAVNNNIQVNDSVLNINEELFISRVVYLLDNRHGSVTELTLVRRSAYETIALPENNKEDSLW